MTVFNLGSINVDHIYRVAALPRPGETISALGHEVMLGGKGANQSVAVARAGRRVVHIGCVGKNEPVVADLAALGVDVRHVDQGGSVTGHANVYVDAEGENLIVILSGANVEQSLTRLETALSEARAGDVLMLQNETDLVREAAEIARERGVFVIYSAAPFDADAASRMLSVIDLLVVNRVEAEQLSQSLGTPLDDIDGPAILVTRGADGAIWRGADTVSQPAFPVEPVDTTGAGDCFIGYVAAALDEGLSVADALRLGAGASALQVTRHGTAKAIPERGEVGAFLAGRIT